MVSSVCWLFILAELSMIFWFDEIFIWFFFDISMVLVYLQFIDIIVKQNTKDHK